MIVDAVIDSLITEPVEEIDRVDGQVEVIEVDSRDLTWDTREGARRDRREE